MLINQNIKAIRKKSGLTQVEFADKLGLVLASLKNYENTEVEPKAETIFRICNFAGITPTDLLHSKIDPSALNIPTVKGNGIAEFTNTELITMAASDYFELDMRTLVREELRKRLGLRSNTLPNGFTRPQPLYNQ